MWMKNIEHTINSQTYDRAHIQAHALESKIDSTIDSVPSYTNRARLKRLYVQ